MNIQCLKEFDLGIKLGHVRSVTVSLGQEMGDAMPYGQALGILLLTEAVR